MLFNDLYFTCRWCLEQATEEGHIGSAWGNDLTWPLWFWVNTIHGGVCSVDRSEDNILTHAGIVSDLALILPLPLALLL